MSEQQPSIEAPAPLAAARLDAIFLGLWRRALAEGSGLDLTLTEAAALLGMSAQTLHRRIQAGEVQTRRDSHGRLRVIPLIGVTPEMVEAAMTTDTQASVARLFEELKRTRQDLSRLEREREALQRELESVKEALDWAQDELASWASPLLQNWSLGQPGDAAHQRSERVRLETRIDEARRLMGRRGWLGGALKG